jgi:hypothetical protein
MDEPRYGSSVQSSIYCGNAIYIDELKHNATNYKVHLEPQFTTKRDDMI